jgi:KDO2-lipid IV(A) lauroyltransferase
MMKLLLGLMWCLHFLPLPILGRVGEWLGRLFYWILPARRHITLTNLRLCFPELTEKERKTIAKQHFQAYARSILERGILWWSSEQRIKKLVRIEPGIPFELTSLSPNLAEENPFGSGNCPCKGSSFRRRSACTAKPLLHPASGREEKNESLRDFHVKEPVILLCPHFVSLDVAGTLGLHIPICSIYTQQRNALFDETLKKGRKRFGDQLFSRTEGVKPIIRAMRKGHGFLMLPDMDFGIKDAVFVPFFGIPAATLTAPARIAAATNAKVIPIIVTMLPNYQGWRITVHPAWQNFPGDDIVAATHSVNTFIETQVRITPAEYLWSHRRFKTRPEGEADFYRIRSQMTENR